MAIQAYVLIEAQAGWADEVIAQISMLPNVKSADPVTGPYDGIAAIEVADLEVLGTVVGEMNSISGIVKTITCIRMKFPRATTKVEKG
jgi:DNA-binding Lrp family transcriptional regulator